MADVRGPHDDHDPMLVASLLDDDLSAEERASTPKRRSPAARTASRCEPTSSRLRPPPATSRSRPAPGTSCSPPDDAARLSGTEVREPGASTARLSGDMTGTTTSAAHASHDTILVASLVDHSLPATERAIAEAQVASCGLCAALYADLDALRTATRALPTPARPRDYSLTPDDAARLRPGGWRRLVAAFGSPRDAFSRPLAVGLTTLGLAGLLVASVPSIMVGGATSGAAPVLDNGAGAPATDRPGDVTVNAPETGGGQPAPGAAAGAPSADPADRFVASARPVPVASGRTTVTAVDPSGPRAPNNLTDGAATAEPGTARAGPARVPAGRPRPDPRSRPLPEPRACRPWSSCRGHCSSSGWGCSPCAGEPAASATDGETTGSAATLGPCPPNA